MGAQDLDTDKPEAYAISCSVIVHHNALLRNKRILCAYHRYRADVLEDHRWEKGPTLTEFARNKISPYEESYFENYNKLLHEYIRDIDIDITSNLQPPKELNLEVQVRENVGDIQTSTGSMNLLMNTRHYGQVNDVETLLRNGQVVKTR
eukprot:UN02959